MGLLTRFFAFLGLSKKRVQLLVVGLDNSGKSTFLNWLRPSSLQVPPAEIAPTVGFHVETLQRDRLTCTVFDMSGQGRYRNLWEHYYVEAHGVIFVVDTSDKMRACVARDELDALLAHKRMLPDVLEHDIKRQ